MTKTETTIRIEEEKENMEKMNTEFPIASVCRADVLGELVDTYDYKKAEATKIAMGMSDATMNRIAGKIADVLFDGDYWITIRDFLEDNGYTKD